MARNNKPTLISEEQATLQRIEELLAVIARALLSEKLAEIFKDPKQRVIYQGAGRLPAQELVKKAHVSHSTISGLWQKWEQEGLLIKKGKQYCRVI